MGFRFRRRLPIAPGVRLNLSNSGSSWSFGRPGARLTFGRRGTFATIGAPGTGISYSQAVSSSRPALLLLLLLAILVAWLL